MYINEEQSKLDINKNIKKKYNMDSMVYFDIETTGFDREQDNVILVSLGYCTQSNNFYIKQYFAENLNDEKCVLENLKNDVEKFNIWCSYNGKAFDQPFLEHRMNKYDIAFKSPDEHFDLYRKIRPYQKQLGLGRCNLKSVEKYIGIDRKDTIDGGISVELYKRYLEDQDENLRKVIMLHNYEDVLNLPKIFKILSKIDSSNFIREDHITEKQLKYLKSLLRKHNILLNINLDNISKRAASKAIGAILNEDYDEESLKDIIKINCR
ncbi:MULTISPECIES: ribonuclease H-like domain-containing protein [Clostridium]|uniref:ribonuclease H-like domain-containing protein n=1 Tax=Clostridium TaxID=1485 RepID=UPI000825B130|nr:MULTISPECIES: ribonuclease H-like domain-containing protein [Clostridium]